MGAVFSSSSKQMPVPETVYQSAQDSVDEGSVSLAALGVVSPQEPGDVWLCGRLPVVALKVLGGECKAWINMLPAKEITDADKAFALAAKDVAGMEWLDAAFAGPVPNEGEAEKILELLDTAPRPLVLQCASGNRAGAALLLWLAKKKELSSAGAAMLASELNLKFFVDCNKCAPMRAWLLAQLPPEGYPSSGAVQAQHVLRQLFDPESCTYTYLIGCKVTNQAVLIDPVLEQKTRDLTILSEMGFELAYVLNTHCHADHVTSGGMIKKELPKVQTIISEASAAKSDIKVQDGSVVSFGSLRLEVLATPGHTNGCVTFLLRSPAGPAMVFTGDALLIRGCGRTDFQQGNSGTLYESIHQRIFTLPDDTIVYPGHDYKGNLSSTVGEEKVHNPRLSKGKEEFIKIMSELNLPYPKRIDVAVPANLVCGVQD